MKKVEYSQIVRQKLKELKIRLAESFGENISRKAIWKITNSIRDLEVFEKKGIPVYVMYGIDCDYWCLYVNHNYIFYRIEEERIIILDMFDEREDFMYKLFGVDDILNDTYYWDD